MAAGGRFGASRGSILGDFDASRPRHHFPGFDRPNFKRPFSLLGFSVMGELLEPPRGPKYEKTRGFYRKRSQKREKTRGFSATGELPEPPRVPKHEKTREKSTKV